MSLSRKSIQVFAPSGLYFAPHVGGAYNWYIYKTSGGDVVEWYVNDSPQNLSYSSKDRALADEGRSYTLVDPSLYSVSGPPDAPNIHFRTLKNAEWLKNTAPDGLYKRSVSSWGLSQFACKKDGVVYYNIFVGDPSPKYCRDGRYTLKKTPIYDGFYGEFTEVPYDGYTVKVGGEKLSFVAPMTIDTIFSTAPDGVYQSSIHTGGFYTLVVKKDGVVYADVLNYTTLRACRLEAKTREFFDLKSIAYTTVNMTGYGVTADGETACITPTVRPRDMRTAAPGLYEAADGSDWKVYVFPERMGLKPLCLSDSEGEYLPGNTFTKHYVLSQAHNG